MTYPEATENAVTAMRARCSRLGVAAALFAVCAVAAPPAAAETAAEKAAPVIDSLPPLVEQLVTALEAGDEALLDDALCLDWVVPDWMDRASVTGGAAPMSYEEALEAYREAATAALRERLDAGAVPGRLDLSRIRVLEGGSPEYVYGQPISADGIVGVRWSDGRITDLPAMRVGEYWCLNPGAPVALR